jgi:hypothetical protein
MHRIARARLGLPSGIRATSTPNVVEERRALASIWAIENNPRTAYNKIQRRPKYIVIR